MARYIGPKNRLARRENVDLGLKTVGSSAHNALLRRLGIPPGQHGVKRKRRLKMSDYGMQLREKQRARRMYGVLERQFRRYFDKAIKRRGATGEVLLQLLERRLDNIVYRLGFMPTRASARQLVTHGHIRVNGKKVSIPSYQVRTDDVISLKPKSEKIPIVMAMFKQKNPIIPLWLSRKGTLGKVMRMPKREDVDVHINEQLIVEFYSR